MSESYVISPTLVLFQYYATWKRRLELKNEVLKRYEKSNFKMGEWWESTSYRSEVNDP